MSDRTTGSVRTGEPGGAAGDGASEAAARSTAGEAPGQRPAAPEKPGTGQQAAVPQPAQQAPARPATGQRPAVAPSGGETRSIPTTGAQRAAGRTQSPTGPVSGRPGPVVPPGGAGGRSSTSGSSGPMSTTPPADRGAPAERGGRGRPAARGRGPRRARLQLRHIDIWSAFKISFVLSIVMFCIWMIAIGLLYLVLNSLGVFSTINDLFGQLGSATGGSSTGTVVRPGIVLEGAAVIGAINVVLWTALCTVATFIYNMCSDLVGGLEVTLSERD